MQRLTVPKHYLILIAGLVWCVAGAMVILVGLPLEMDLAPGHLVLIPLAVAIFLAFYLFVFSRLVHKHTSRIREHEDERLPFWRFFDTPSWIVMAVMMGGGMALRLTHTVPDWFIAFFYTGLGIALFLCGLRFVDAFRRGDALAVAPGPEGRER